MSAPKLFDFRWSVHESGYTWGPPVPGEYDPDQANWYRCLLPVNPGEPVCRYHPLRKYPILYRTFARIDPGSDGEEILHFAGAYGSLGRPPAGYRRDIGPMDLPDGLDDWDVFFFWLKAITSMRDLVQLWDAVRTRDQALLQTHIIWKKDGSVVYDNQTDSKPGSLLFMFSDSVITVIASDEKRPEWLEYFTPGDVVTPAMFHIMGMVNLWMTGLTNPRLEWDEDERRLVTRIVPSSLLGALWLQFHQAISNQTDYRQCDVCKSWFEISPKTNRPTRLHCGDACRSQAYRDRQKRAKQLHGEGWSIKDIAGELGSDLRTVKKWIRNRKE